MLCHTQEIFQRCTMSILSDMAEDTIEVFMDDFSLVKDPIDQCLSHLAKVLNKCKDCNLVLN